LRKIAFFTTLLYIFCCLYTAKVVIWVIIRLNYLFYLRCVKTTNATIAKAHLVPGIKVKNLSYVWWQIEQTIRGKLIQIKELHPNLADKMAKQIENFRKI